MSLLPARLRRRLEKDILVNQRYRAWAVRLGAALNARSIRLAARSRALVRFMNHHTTDAESDRFVTDLPRLHAEITRVLEEQRTKYPHYSYFYGHPYQSLGILGVFGERATEERFDAYGLADFVGREDTVLDVGCNCGFMALYTAFRTGCRAHGIDINEYMIEIGRLCAEHLRIADRVNLEAVRIQDFEPGQKYSVVFSFATHWTDDGNYRVAVERHLQTMHDLLADGGTLVFESHSADLDDPKFHEAMDGMRSRFEWEGSTFTDRHTRELFIMRKLAAG
ncbi:MAG: class I SAM-dependent methyltransferase [Planctomycetota bacterium]|jgi:SAM-dependent methyltransferase